MESKFPLEFGVPGVDEFTLIIVVFHKYNCNFTFHCLTHPSEVLSYPSKQTQLRPPRPLGKQS